MKSDPTPISITGWGMTTPLGITAPQTWEALLSGRAVADHSPAILNRVDGEDRITQLAVHAAREAIEMSGWQSVSGAALVVGTSKGPVERWLGDGRSVAACEFGLAATTNCIARALQLGDGPRLLLSAACASGLHALARAAMLLERGEADRTLIIAVESSLHPLFIGCFQRLGVLPKRGVGCRPFDRQRDGFLISEAAAAVCLERGSRGVRLERYAIGGAAGHLTGGDVNGGALRYLLKQTIGGGAVNLVHAHGTGTIAHDPVELAALEEQAAGANIYSHKGALGHSLGAAGLISVVVNCLSHRQGIIPGNVNTSEPMETRHVELSRRAVIRPVRRSLALASGFGGSMGAVCLASDDLAIRPPRR